MINRERLALGIAALKSGLYVQGQSALKKLDPDDNRVKHCCLGVLTEIAILNGCEDVRHSNSGLDFEELVTDESDFADEDATIWREQDTGELVQAVMNWYGLTQSDPVLTCDTGIHRAAIDLNDSTEDPKPFGYIADAFERTFMGDEQETAG